MGGIYTIRGVTVIDGKKKLTGTSCHFDAQCSVCTEIVDMTKAHLRKGHVGCSCGGRVKRVKAEDFIGTVFKTEVGSYIKVTSIKGKSSTGVTIFNVDCSFCSEDVELYPEGITASKQHLVNNVFPCMCTKSPKLNYEQDLVVMNRILLDMKSPLRAIEVSGRLFSNKSFIFICEVCSLDTELFPYGSIAGTKSNIKQGGMPCGCGPTPNWSSSQWEIKVSRRCNELGYKRLDDNAISKGRDRVELYNPITDNTWDVSVNNFINQNNKDPKEAQLRSKELGVIYGYYPHRVDEKDYLYVVDFHTYIKVGRSFDVTRRLKDLTKESGGIIPKALHLTTATHQEVYDMEQEIHEELTSRGFYHHESTWSTETFDKDSLGMVYQLIDSYDYERVEDHPTLVPTHPIDSDRQT